jgi:arginase
VALVGYLLELIAARLGAAADPAGQGGPVDARDLDPPEGAYLVGAHALGGIADLGPAVLPDWPLYVHLDADMIDLASLPGLRYPTSGGPDSAAVADALRMLVATGRVATAGIACSWHHGDGAAAAEPSAQPWDPPSPPTPTVKPQRRPVAPPLFLAT